MVWFRFDLRIDVKWLECVIIICICEDMCVCAWVAKCYQRDNNRVKQTLLCLCFQHTGSTKSNNEMASFVSFHGALRCILQNMLHVSLAPTSSSYIVLTVCLTLILWSGGLTPNTIFNFHTIFANSVRHLRTII